MRFAAAEKAADPCGLLFRLRKLGKERLEDALQAALVFAVANETLQLEMQRLDFFRRRQLADFCDAVVEQRCLRRVFLVNLAVDHSLIKLS
jgi:hypothetical protein